MSSYAIPNKQMNQKRKPFKKYSMTKNREFIRRVIITFAILFLFSMCIYAFFSGSAMNEEAPIIIMDEVVSETETQPENTATYTDNDLFCLAAAVCREAGKKSEEIQLLVANVIINRVNSSHYPNTIYGVLTQYKQYGTMWRDGVSFPDWATDDIKEQCYNVAKRILDGERFCPENVVFQAGSPQGSGIYKYFDEGYYFCY